MEKVKAGLRSGSDMGKQLAVCCLLYHEIALAITSIAMDLTYHLARRQNKSDASPSCAQCLSGGPDLTTTSEMTAPVSAVLGPKHAMCLQWSAGLSASKTIITNIDGDAQHLKARSGRASRIFAQPARLARSILVVQMGCPRTTECLGLTS